MESTNNSSINFKKLSLIIGPLLITIVIVAAVAELLRTKNDATNVDSNPVSFATDGILPIQKGTNPTDTRVASNPDSFVISGYRIDLSNGWKHTKNILGLKDTNFISNIININPLTATNGDSTQMFYITKGDYTFYVSNQFITESKIYYEDGPASVINLNTQYLPDGTYFVYTMATIATGDADSEGITIKKQAYVCPDIFKNLCFASGYFPLEKDSNAAAVEAFQDFLKSLNIYVQN